jgi:hypothetical protein
VGTASAYGVSGATGAKVLELDANCTGTVTGVYQDITTVAGQTYQLSSMWPSVRAMPPPPTPSKCSGKA